MRRITPLVGGFLLMLTLLSGCSSDSSSDVGPTGPSSAQSPGAQAYTDCMRDHGVPMSDPDPSTGKPAFDAGVDQSSAAVKKALAACVSLLPAEVRETAGPEDQAAYLAFAHCMRENGLPQFPDPQPGPDGVFPDSGIDRDSPAFQKASAACQQVLDGATP